MQSLRLNILNETGLHARPAATFVKTAKKFQASVRVRNITSGSEWADAKSVLGVLALGVEYGHEIELEIQGDDEDLAAEALQEAIRSGLGEGIVPPQPVQNELPQTLRGIPAAPGIAQGTAVLWREATLHIPRFTQTDPAAELERIRIAKQSAQEEIIQLREKVATEASAEEAAIFEAHLLIADDSSLLGQIETSVNQGVNAEAAWADGVDYFAGQLEKLGDPILQARAMDVRDVGQRVLRHLLGETREAGLDLRQPSLVVARDLTPSQTAGLPKDLVLGFCTAEGGPTSHTAILAKALGLPAVVGLGVDLLDVPDGTPLLVDGTRGEVIVRPDRAQLQAFKALQASRTEQALAEQAVAAEAAITLDGHAVEVVANVGEVEDARRSLEFGAEGIGLLRTEFLYLRRESAPTEEEQVQAYTSILEVMGERPVVMRTLDVGGDKMLPYLDLGREANPFLGWRAIRLCLDQPDLFKAQLRAMLRAGVGHDLRIMFPMIATLDELRQAKVLLEQARGEVQSAGQAAATSLQVGMMVEVPAAAMMADIFAREVDFFSIGTNDLTQYTMAAERTNQKVAYLGDGCHPAVLRQIQQVVIAGHANGAWVGVCGELAGDPEAIPILVGLGVDELSMAPAAIPRAKAIIRRWRLQDARQLAGEVLSLESGGAVRAHLQAFQGR